MTTNLKIAKASLILISASILGHLLSLFKEVLSAKYFGLTRGIDALYAALTIPNYIGSIVLLPFSILFIPLFIKYNVRDKEEANRVASTLINGILVILFIAASVVFIFSPPIIAVGFKGLDAPTAHAAVNMLRIFSMTIVFAGITGMITCLLNAYEHFTWPAFSQMFITLAVIIFMALFARSWGVYTIVFGTALGLAAQAVFLLLLAKKRGFRYYAAFNLDHPAVKEITGFAGFLTLITILSGSNLIIGRVMASYLTSGSIAALAYADKIIQVPLIIFAGSVNTAIYPYFALQIATNKIDELKDTLAASIKMGGLIFIPIAGILIIFARPIIRVLFQRGAFDLQATELTSAILVCFALQLLSYYAMVIIMRLLFALREYGTIVKVLMVNIVVTIALNFLFMRFITPPVAGIALSTSAGCFVSTILFFVYLKKRMEYLHGVSMLVSLLKTTLLAVIASAVMRLIYGELNTAVAYSSLSQMSIIIGSIFAGLLLFVVLALLIRFAEMTRLINLVQNKILPRF